MGFRYTLGIYIILSYFNSALLLTSDFSLSELCHNKKGGEKSYAVVPLKVDWFEAFSFCKQKKMDLATIMSKKDQNKLNAELRKDEETQQDFWLSATRYGAMGHSEFVWFSDGFPVIYSNWGTNDHGIQQPDNYGGSEKCVILHTETSKKSPWKWSDTFCGQKHAFVCQTKCN